jgi:hypothetical protein
MRTKIAPTASTRGERSDRSVPSCPLNCDFYRKIASSSYSEVVEGNRLISIPTELVFGSFSHDPSTASPTLSLVGMRTVSHRATRLLELWISNYYLKERCFDNNDVYPVSVSHKHTFAPDERD